MQRVMADDVSEEFKLTERLVNYMTSNLELFANGEHIRNDNDIGGKPISSWLMEKLGPTGSSSGLVLHQTIAGELDFVYVHFLPKFRPLLESIVGQRPALLSPNDLDFRCKKVDELRQLQELGLASSIFGMFLDTFFSELYLHCLLRKLALIVVHHIEPTQLVRQFVDVYLEFPVTSGPRQADSSQQQQPNLRLVQSALNFNLQAAANKYGPLEVAAELVFDPRTMFSMDINNKQVLVAQFKQECHALMTRLDEVWADFDGFAQRLSSQMNDLSHFNERVKLASPQLIYGVICGQLSQL